MFQFYVLKEERKGKFNPKQIYTSLYWISYLLIYSVSDAYFIVDKLMTKKERSNIGMYIAYVSIISLRTIVVFAITVIHLISPKHFHLAYMGDEERLSASLMKKGNVHKMDRGVLYASRSERTYTRGLRYSLTVLDEVFTGHNNQEGKIEHNFQILISLEGREIKRSSKSLKQLKEYSLNNSDHFGHLIYEEGSHSYTGMIRYSIHLILKRAL